MRLSFSLTFLSLFLFTATTHAQAIKDDFEGNGVITTWFGDACAINTTFANPFPQGINSSATVLEYRDNGGQYANVRFEVNNKFDIATNPAFSLMIYVPSSGLTGSQTNKISLKLQDGSLAEPWSTQCEIIKPIVLNQWQTITFNFATDTYINLSGSSPAPTLRTDFDRVVIQVNGENNTDKVVAYLDNIAFDGTVVPDPVFDKLVWSDEFDVNGALNVTKWHHQTQLPAGGSWYNGEIQHYTNRTDNAVVQDGLLKIIAKKETYTNQGYTKQYTSARLNSKAAFKYGKVEVRAKLPSGVGTWPAIWMLGKNVNEDGGYWDIQGYGNTGWPACGEIDIMEHWGTNQNFVQSALHTPSSSGATVNHGGQTIPTASTEFHIYTLEWTAQKMVFKVDGVPHYTYNPAVKNASTWPFNAEQYLLLNIAIQPSIYAGFTQAAMEIDYVRVYQQSATAVSPATTDATPVVYPNPVQEVLTLEVPHADGKEVELSIYSADGKQVKAAVKQVFNGIVTLDELDGLPAGIYTVSYPLGDRIQYVRFVKD